MGILRKPILKLDDINVYFTNSSLLFNYVSPIAMYTATHENNSIFVTIKGNLLKNNVS
jgi:hypothetical protein